MIKKKLWIIPLVCLLLFTYNPIKVKGAIEVSARNAILMEQKSGRVLFEKNAHEKRRIASITKIMTAILAIESGKLDEMVTVSERATRPEGSSIYLRKGEKIKLRDLVYGLMLRSGNDAAIAIAEHVGGSLEGFVFLMNQKAQELGMTNTSFANPHGLDDSDHHYSTAYDMAILTRYAMENDTYREISGTKVHRAPNPYEKWDRVWRNKNRLLTELYSYSTGGKTGYTKLAKRTLVSTAEKNGMELIAVTLNAPNDWVDHINMFEYAYRHYDLVEVMSTHSISNIKNEVYRKNLYIKNNFYYPVTKEERSKFHIDIKLLEPKRNIEEMPEVVGKGIIYFNNEPIKEIPIYFKKPEEEPSWFERFKKIFTSIIGVKNNG